MNQLGEISALIGQSHVAVQHKRDSRHFPALRKYFVAMQH